MQSLSLQQIAELVQGQIEGEANGSITGVAKIEEAESDQITFLANPKYAKHLESSKAMAVLVPPGLSPCQGPVRIVTQDPYLAFLKIVIYFSPPEPLIEEGIHPSAILGEGSEIGDSVSIGARVVIGRKCRIGKGTVILSGTVIGDGAQMGEDCMIHANCSVREKVIIGNRVILQDGSVIGSDGFGFVPINGVYEKIPQVGTVMIEDDVEIGANTTIDRATIGETRIKKGAKIDNLVQIAHHCEIGEHTVIAAQAGLSGSTIIGKGVRVGGQAGFGGHMKIGDGAAIGAQAGVVKSVPDGVMVSGYPARPHQEELRKEATIHRLPQLLKEFKELKKQIQQLVENTRST
ncbi:UDP-3-O-(3-hydroxymyristoyl)glucosamine N-acyltransferase [candidate division KSB1 bacterium]|nr:UDP-3-O-(3-hydroxymyristoyl)glucosamine N-acyltransferase [candidate division KSB1 bacterium]